MTADWLVSQQSSTLPSGDADDQTLRVEELAATAAISVTSFHRHFRVLTSMTPIQFQKHRPRVCAVADEMAGGVAGPCGARACTLVVNGAGRQRLYSR
jgi:methylphosphotriester-DNA--protein-cysteine methyltransferase